MGALTLNTIWKRRQAQAVTAKEMTQLQDCCAPFGWFPFCTLSSTIASAGSWTLANLTCGAGMLRISSLLSIDFAVKTFQPHHHEVNGMIVWSSLVQLKQRVVHNNDRPTNHIQDHHGTEFAVWRQLWSSWIGYERFGNQMTRARLNF